MKKLIDKLVEKQTLTHEEWAGLIDACSPELMAYAAEHAQTIQQRIFGKGIFIRGLIEISNYCKNNCLYCGIRAGNHHVGRYRLSREEILSCCREGYRLGFRTFVMQGGEDNYFSDAYLCDLISKIKREFPDCALTLSLGEKSRESYEKLFFAGADRYLLRHETADEAHYGNLHPKEMSYQNRMRCLRDLREIGFQTGCGFMVGSPGQTTASLARDMIFLKEFNPQMVGIGPFISHHDTPFKAEKNGSTDLTVFLLSLIRIMLPYALLPATTALATAHASGRERGILAGANVVMPNLSPVSFRKKYELYDNKISTDTEAAEGLAELQKKIEAIGYKIDKGRGDAPTQP